MHQHRWRGRRKRHLRLTQGVQLFCMDLLYDVENGIVTNGSGGVIEACINAVTLDVSPDWGQMPPRAHAGAMDETRTALAAKLAEIDEQMATMEMKPDDQGSISFGKRIGEGTSMAVDRLAQVAVHDKLQVTRTDVVRAIEKLDDGTYGSCDVCAKPIPEGRLEALPWAVLCVEDAARS